MSERRRGKCSTYQVHQDAVQMVLWELMRRGAQIPTFPATSGGSIRLNVPGVFDIQANGHRVHRNSWQGHRTLQAHESAEQECRMWGVYVEPGPQRRLWWAFWRRFGGDEEGRGNSGSGTRGCYGAARRETSCCNMRQLKATKCKPLTVSGSRS
jgi:hypothetical protein